MGIVSTITIGSNTYSVYSLTTDPLADAKAYFAARLGAEPFTGATRLQQQQALITAARGFDRLLWSGEKLVGAQATQWPRTGAVCNGDVEPDGTPDEIALGEFELALVLLSDPTTLDKKTTRSDVRRVGAGTASVTFFQAPPGEETRLPTIVHELVGCFLEGASAGIGTPLASGTDAASEFTEDDFDRADGFA